MADGTGALETAKSTALRDLALARSHVAEAVACLTRADSILCVVIDGVVLVPPRLDLRDTASWLERHPEFDELATSVTAWSPPDGEGPKGECEDCGSLVPIGGEDFLGARVHSHLWNGERCSGRYPANVVAGLREKRSAEHRRDHPRLPCALCGREVVHIGPRWDLAEVLYNSEEPLEKAREAHQARVRRGELFPLRKHNAPGGSPCPSDRPTFAKSSTSGSQLVRVK